MTARVSTEALTAIAQARLPGVSVRPVPGGHLVGRKGTDRALLVLPGPSDPSLRVARLVLAEHTEHPLAEARTMGTEVLELSALPAILQDWLAEDPPEPEKWHPNMLERAVIAPSFLLGRLIGMARRSLRKDPR